MTTYEQSPPGAQPRSAEALVDDRDREWPWTETSARLAAASPFHRLATVHPMWMTAAPVTRSWARSARARSTESKS
jgi:hypothetical protein